MLLNIAEQSKTLFVLRDNKVKKKKHFSYYLLELFLGGY